MLQSFQTNFQKNLPDAKVATFSPSPPILTPPQPNQWNFDAPSNYFKLSTFLSLNIHFFENYHFSKNPNLKIGTFLWKMCSFLCLGKIIHNLRLKVHFWFFKIFSCSSKVIKIIERNFETDFEPKISKKSRLIKKTLFKISSNLDHRNHLDFRFSLPKKSASTSVLCQSILFWYYFMSSWRHHVIFVSFRTRGSR